MPEQAIDALLEIFTWVGLGAGALVALIALIMHLADGTWLPVRAVIDDTDQGRVARWFDDDGGVNQARLSHEQDREIGAADMADVYYRRGVAHRMRLTPRAPGVRAIGLLAIGLLGVGVLAAVTSLIVLFVRG